MYSKLTLIVLFNLLVSNISFAKDAALESCEAAVHGHQYAQAVNIAEQYAGQPEFWLCKGRAQAGLAQNAAAQESFRQAIALKPQGVDLISAHMLLGNAQEAAKNTAGALENYQQALRFSEQQDLRRYMRVAHNLIGEALYGNGQHAESLQAFQAGEKLAANDDERADSYIHEAMAYQQLQQLDSAIEYQLKGVMMLQKSGTPEQYAEASLTLGKLFTSKKDYVGAGKTYQRLMAYARENGGAFYEAKTALYWAETKREQGDMAGAEQLVKEAGAIALKLQDAELDEMLAKAK
ncbi:Tetratricopeptide repeat-containing protein [Methylophilus rhizosphaerae]|uniref:Tetratricopeptide repeat-containing protein n=1 Tax=Methylophilus rhizosphaerae TaxID=492660 RepID=A0A1G9AT38_9PROT|nr:Tetratricopeptide repeat-containing protein [Methylophilus rhizosphaerae]